MVIVPGVAGCRYASEQLNWLVALSLGKRPMEQIAKWQVRGDPDVAA